MNLIWIGDGYVVRWIGCGLITIGCVSFGLRLIYGNHRRLNDLRLCILALQLLAQGISYKKENIVRLFGEIGEQLDGTWGEGFLGIQNELCICKSKSFFEIWKSVFGPCVAQSFLSREEQKRWLELGHYFGYPNASNQAAMLAEITHYMERQYQKLEAEIPGRNRTLFSVTMITGILILLYFV